jgi:signal transduction histidine kinase
MHMMLRPRTVASSVLVALPAALLLTVALDRIRARDQERALRDVVLAQANDQLRERCDSDPGWFMTGPLVGRPAGGVFVPAVPDQNEPRAKYTAQAFELFGYDEAFVGSGHATPPLPADIRRLIRWAKEPIVEPYLTDAGRGVHMWLATGWNGSKCQYLYARLAPTPHQWRDRLITFSSVFAVVALMALVAAAPTVARIRKIAKHARESVDGGFTSIAPEKLKDELSSLTFVYNDAMTELTLRKNRIDDQDVALRRLVQSADVETLQPLATLERTLGNALRAHPADGLVLDGFLKAHDLRAQLENLTATTRLRMTASPVAKQPVDLVTLTERVSERQRTFAQARRVSLKASMPATAVVVEGDAALLECALANMIDNAIRYNRDGGTVTVGLDGGAAGHGFRLWVADDGAGVTDELFRGLTAVRRFRGDEGRHRRPDTPGLGISVTREIADRLGLQLDLKRPGAGGFEAELSPRRS